MEKLDSRVLNMNGKWGEDIARILNVSQETNAAVDKRLSLLSEQSDNAYTRLQNLIKETTAQQTVMMTTIESMEGQLAQVPMLTGGSAVPSSPEPVRLPSTLFGEDVDAQQSHPIVGDSVTSPVHLFSKEGPKLSPSPALSPVKVRV